MILNAACNGYACVILNYLCADDLWQPNNSNNLRPIFLQIAASSQTMKPIVASLRSGELIKWEAGTRNNKRVELLRTAPYEWHLTKRGEGSILTVFHGPICKINPGLIGDRVAFACIPPTPWIEKHGEAAMDLWAIKQLDRRVRCPILPGQDFASMIMRHGITREYISHHANHSWRMQNERYGFHQFYVWNSKQADAEQLIADCTREFKKTRKAA